LAADYRQKMSFVNPFFLFGALAAAVPLILHLVKREHARKIEFPSLMFLRRISKKTIRYQKLRHLLLLLLRIMALVLLVLAFMRPYRQSAESPAVVGAVTRAHIILVDHSMSMGYRDRWDRAKAAVADIVRGAKARDKFALLEFSDRTIALTQLTTDASEVMTQIESGMELTDQSTRYGQALKAAEKLALESGTGLRIIYLISDFQKNGWAGEERDFRLGAGLDLKPVDVGSDDFSNLAIRDVHITEADPAAGGGIQIKASAVDLGARDRNNVRVSLQVDGRAVAEQRVNIRKGETQRVEFHLPDMIAGTHPVTLEVEDPDLTRDNRFFMTLETRGKTDVTLVGNQETGGRRSSGFFLENALNAGPLSPYKLSSVSPQSLNISGGLLIWNNVAGGNAASQKKLRDFVSEGGGIVLVLSDPALMADFNRSFGSWLPVRITEPAASGNRVNLRPSESYVLMTDVRMDHPIFQPFAKPHSGSFASARFFNHVRLSAGPGAEVLARFDNGDAALIAAPVGKGRTLVFASSADESSNDLPLKAVYAPFWQQMLRYLENFQERRHWLDLGETADAQKLLADAALRQAKGHSNTDEAVVVLDPLKQRLSLASGARQFAVDKAGFYDVRTQNLNATIAVNTLPAESDLAHGNPEEMVSGWISSKPAVFSQEPRTPEEHERTQRIWILFLTAAFVFLVSELLLSNGQLTTAEDQQPAAVNRNQAGGSYESL
jgi:hypothetical protein